MTALIEKIIKIKSPEELIPIAITIYTELYPRVVEILKGCDGVSEELKEKLAVIFAYVQAKEFFPKSLKQLKLDSQKSLFKSVLLWQCSNMETINKQERMLALLLLFYST